MGLALARKRKAHMPRGRKGCMERVKERNRQWELVQSSLCHPQVAAERNSDDEFDVGNRNGKKYDCDVDANAEAEDAGTSNLLLIARVRPGCLALQRGRGKHVGRRIAAIQRAPYFGDGFVPDAKRVKT
jgi:hypothetical protein